ncbi:MAG: hypothetical protein JXA82_13800 [Sedimentisphaerales bacterium]|nr:hypothetical protein [Sedimentisphaerales bacterium]
MDHCSPNPSMPAVVAVGRSEQLRRPTRKKYRSPAGLEWKWHYCDSRKRTMIPSVRLWPFLRESRRPAANAGIKKPPLPRRKRRSEIYE